MVLKSEALCPSYVSYKNVQFHINGIGRLFMLTVRKPSVPRGARRMQEVLLPRAQSQN